MSDQLDLQSTYEGRPGARRRRLTIVVVTGLLAVLAPSLASASPPGHAVISKAKPCRKGSHYVVKGRGAHRHLVCMKNRRHTRPAAPSKPRGGAPSVVPIAPGSTPGPAPTAPSAPGSTPGPAPTAPSGPPPSIPGPPPGPPPHSANANARVRASSVAVGGIDAFTSGTWECYNQTVSVSSYTLSDLPGDGVYAYPFVYDYRAPGGAGWYSGLWIQASSIYAVSFPGIVQPDLTGYVTYARNVNGQWQYNGEWYSISEPLDIGFC